MAIILPKSYSQDVAQPVTVRHGDGLLFTGNAAADTITVMLYKDGAAYSPGGSVALKCIRADGVTVAVDGSISGNAATATLTANCCTVPGPLAVVMQITSGGTVGAVFAAVYNVEQSATGTVVAADNMLDDIDALIAEIQAAVASIPVDYSVLSNDYAATVATLGMLDSHPGSLGATSSNNQTFVNVGTANNSHVALQVWPGTLISVTANSSYEAVIAAVKSYTEPTESGSSPDYSAATGWTKNIVLSAGESLTNAVIPNDAKYILVSIKNGTHTQTPAAFTVQGRTAAIDDQLDSLDGRVGTLENDVIIPDMTTAGLDSLPTHPGCLGNSSGNTRIFQNVGTANNYHVVIPVRSGMRVTLTANSSYEAVIAAVKSYTEPTTSGTSPNYSAWPGWDENIKIDSGKSFDAPVPDDAHYLLLSMRQGTHTQKPSAFSTGALAICHLLMGDSITDGSYSENGSLKSGAHNRTYGAWMSERTGFTPTNIGIGGSGWKRCGNSSQSTKFNARMQIDNRDAQGAYVIDFTKYDLLTALWGVNDWKGSEPFGTIDFAQSVTPNYTAVSNPDGNPMYKGYYELVGSYYVPTTDTTVNGSKTYYSTPQDFVTNMRYFIESVQTRNPALKIIIISPLNSTTGDGNSAANDWGAGFEFAGKTLNDYCTAMKTICEHYNIQFVDMLHDSIINRINAETMLPDGVHPSLEAHRQIGIALAGKIMYG